MNLVAGLQDGNQKKKLSLIVLVLNYTNCLELYQYIDDSCTLLFNKGPYFMTA